MSWKLRKGYDSLDERLKALGLNFSFFVCPKIFRFRHWNHRPAIANLAAEFREKSSRDFCLNIKIGPRITYRVVQKRHIFVRLVRLL